MKKSEIKFSIELDTKNIPEKIFWEATDNPNGKKEETKAIALAYGIRNDMPVCVWTFGQKTCPLMT